MSTGGRPRVEELSPSHAWAQLKENDRARLIDVRTSAEWSFVGVPDLSSLGQETIFVEWQRWPGMSRNPQFVEALAEALVGPQEPDALLFICRSGTRSMRAAEAVLQEPAFAGRNLRLVNVKEGFEGDLDSHGHRGGTSGWKARGLPWRQS